MGKQTEGDKALQMAERIRAVRTSITSRRPSIVFSAPGNSGTLSAKG